MKKILFCLCCLCLVGCSPSQPTLRPTPTHTQTEEKPSATVTEIPFPTPTPTPDQDNLAEVDGLANWVAEFVHALGGKKVSLDDSPMDADQLTQEIIRNQEQFIVKRQVDGIEYAFLLVNGLPISLRQGHGLWQDATLKAMGSVADLKIGCLISYGPGKKDWWGDCIFR